VTKYFDKIPESITLGRKAGSDIAVSPEFRVYSSVILSSSIFLQSLIQQVIFSSHGAKRLFGKSLEGLVSVKGV